MKKQQQQMESEMQTRLQNERKILEIQLDAQRKAMQEQCEALQQVISQTSNQEHKLQYLNEVVTKKKVDVKGSLVIIL